MQLPKLHLLGTGRLAWSLAKAWKANHGEIGTIYGRNPVEAESLAIACGGTAISQLNTERSGWLVLAVSDDALIDLANSLTPSADILVVHCSGTSNLEVLNTHPHSAVIWPLQSLQKAGNDWSTIPLFTEGRSMNDAALINHIASTLSNIVVPTNSLQRQQYHLAAVMAGNFSNALYQQVYSYLKELELDPRYLLPILTKGLENLMETPPQERQTGPAARGDEKVMQAHLQLLREKPELIKLYELMSGIIAQEAKK